MRLTPRALAVVAALLTAAPIHAADPLPSWKDGPSKKAIVAFVEKVTKEGGPDVVPVTERVAVFDNDGTLWPEQPMYVQAAFVNDRVKALAAKHPVWREKQPFKGVLEGDVKALAAAGDKGVMELMMATHAGMTTDEFEQIVKDWLATATHPRFKRSYTELVYQPMLELLAYLRANGFQTYIASGGGVEFMRPWTETTYGVPPGQVIGSTSCATTNPSWCGSRSSSLSMTDRASRPASTGTSATALSRRSATPTATTRCCAGRRPGRGRASD